MIALSTCSPIPVCCLLQVDSDEVIIKQGDEQADYFYVIQS